MRISMELENSTTADQVEEGLRLCRAGQWNKGLPVLAAAIENRATGEQISGLAYSFLGYGVARYQGKHSDGLKLCEHALKIEYFESDNHWNLARVHALSSTRWVTVQALENGLKLDPDHPGLLALHQEIGVRREPVLRMFDRAHPLNRLLGRLRHRMKSKPAPPGRTQPS